MRLLRIAVAVVTASLTIFAFAWMWFRLPDPLDDLEVHIQFETENPPAVPEPAAEDRDWHRGGYEPLIPARDDGRPTFSNDWFRWGPTWIDAAPHLLHQPGLRYLEVGVYEGQAMVWAFENILTHPTSRAVAVDLFAHEGLQDRFLDNIARAGLADRVTTKVGFSNVVLRELTGEFDIIYIDASHTGFDVLRDAVLAWDLLPVGGVLIFDDYRYDPELPDELRPGPSIDAFITAFRDELRIHQRGWQIIVERIPDRCSGVASPLGPYCFDWEARVLVDPRTRARVPITEEERELIETILKSRPPGEVDVVVRPEFAESDAFRRLRVKLRI